MKNRKILYLLVMFSVLLALAACTATPADPTAVEEEPAAPTETTALLPTDLPALTDTPAPTETPLTTPTTVFDPMKVRFSSQTYFIKNVPGGGVVYSVAFSLDSSRYAFAGNGPISIIETRNLTREYVLEGHQDIVTAIVWTPDGNFLGSVSQDGTLILWETETFTQAGILDTGPATTFEVSPDSQLFGVGTAQGEIQIWDIASETKLATLISPTGAKVKSVQWSPDGTLIASGEETGQIYLWNAETGEVDITLSDYGTALSSTNSLDWSLDGKLLASGHDDGNVHIWDTASWEVIRTIKAQENWINSVRWMPNRLVVSTVGESENVALWSTETGEKITGFGIYGEGHVSDWSPNGKMLVMGGHLVERSPSGGKFGYSFLGIRIDNQ